MKAIEVIKSGFNTSVNFVKETTVGKCVAIGVGLLVAGGVTYGIIRSNKKKNAKNEEKPVEEVKPAEEKKNEEEGEKK